ncbi:hypothetical protein ACFO4O_04350 [Glaciecola siphonariae]|uniref:Phage tail protein n=1 Tax=Glaciecola siphonariae TaxID=521012 RepID=A0ABV9LTQ8_9ALTE
MADTSILAGSKFEYSVDDGTTYVELYGITEWPEFKNETEDEEVTEVRHETRQYAPGLDSPTELALTANYYKNNADQLAFRTLARNNGSCKVKMTYKDGDTAEAEVDLRNYGIAGGGAAERKKWMCTLRRTTDIDFTESAS